MTRNLSVWNSLRPFSVGFDSIFEEFDRMLELLSDIILTTHLITFVK